MFSSIKHRWRLGVLLFGGLVIYACTDLANPPDTGKYPLNVQVKITNSENSVLDPSNPADIPEVDEISLLISGASLYTPEGGVYSLPFEPSPLSMDPENPVSYASESSAPANRYRRFELSLGTPTANESSSPAISIEGQYDGQSYSYELFEPVTLDFAIDPSIELGEEDASPLTLIITFNYLKWLQKEGAIEGWDHSDSEEIISRVLSSATIEVIKESPDGPIEVVESVTVGTTKHPQAAESSGSLPFTVKLSKAISNILEVDYRTVDKTAVSGSDFLKAEGTLVFEPGSTTKTLEVGIIDDDLFEDDETFELELTGTRIIDQSNTLSKSAGTTSSASLSPTGKTGPGKLKSFSKTAQRENFGSFKMVQKAPAAKAVIDSNLKKATGTILNDDDPIVKPKVRLEGSPAKAENSGPLRFTIELSEATSETVEIDYRTLDQTATSGSDYKAKSGTLVIPPNELAATVDVALINDEEVEPDETLILELTAVRGGEIDTQAKQAVGTILNDDEQEAVSPPLVSISNVPSASEGNGPISFTIKLSRAAEESVEVDYRTVGNSATAGSDFLAASGTVVFPPGSVEKSVRIELVDDTEAETDESFELELLAARGATIDDNKRKAAAVIFDDDEEKQPEPPVSVGIANNPRNAENAGKLSFSILLSAEASEDIEVDYQTIPGTADAGSDYEAAASTLLIPAGSLEGVIKIVVIDDEEYEADEEFGLMLTDVRGGVIDSKKATATGTILNDDPEPEPVVISLAGDVEAPESNGSLEFTVQLSQAATENVVVDYTTSDQSALAGSDYTSAAGSLSIPQGSTTGIIPVAILDDEEQESDETFTLRLTSVVGGQLNNSAKQATGTILNDDEAPQAPPPAVSITNSPQAMENAGPLTFTLELSATPEQAVEITYQTINKTAKRDEDFEHISGTLLFPAGTTEQQLVVNLIDDDRVEADETFELELLSATGATLNSAYRKATGTILNDDEEPVPPVTAAITGNRQAPENAGSLSFTVRLSDTAEEAVEIDYRTLGNTAQPGVDFQAASGVLVIPAGDLEGNVEVLLIDDEEYESDETFTFELTGIRGGELDNSATSATGTILNDDPEPEPVTVGLANNPQAAENETDLSFIVRLSRSIDETVEVRYQTVNKTAKAGSDYIAADGTLTFSPGTSQQTIAVGLIDDREFEPQETFELHLVSATGAAIDNTQKRATATITDDDPEPVPVTAGLSGDVEGAENSGQLAFRVHLSEPADEEVEVDYRTLDQSAKAGSDYQAASGTLIIAAGDTEGYVEVTLTDDGEVENDEQFILELTEVRGAILDADSNRATATILDDDEEPAAPKISVSLADEPEAFENGGSISFTVRLSEASTDTVKVDFETQDNSAHAGSDYEAATGTVVFAPGTTAMQVTVTLIDDEEWENDEKFFLNLLSATGAEIQDNAKKTFGTILNDDEKDNAKGGNGKGNKNGKGS